MYTSRWKTVLWNRTTHSTPVQTGVVVFFPGSRVAVSTQSLRFALSSFLLLSLTENGLNECQGTLLRTTRRSRGGAARGGGTPSSTSKAPGSSARRRTFLCTFTTLHKVRIRPSLQSATHATSIRRHAARATLRGHIAEARRVLCGQPLPPVARPCTRRKRAAPS